MIWDVIKSCEREGSLDSRIKAVEVNDIEALLLKYKSIQYVLCNGNKSYTLWNQYFSSLQVTCIALPSTSNANRSIQESVLFKKWFDALDIALL